MLILASGSPRRRDLLHAAGLEFQIIPSPAEELHDLNMPLHQLCETNAELKALAIANNHPNATVIGADTLVYIDKTPLGKPQTKDEARQMLTRLSGRTHQVCTGVCITQGKKKHTFHTLTEVVFKTLTPTIIKNYLTKVNVMDKAGSYAAQEHPELIIATVKGDYDNVIGLPMNTLLEELHNFTY